MIVSVLVLLFFLLTIWTSVSAVIVAVIVLPVQVMEPSGPTLRVQLDGQPVVPAAVGRVILVEFAKVAALISPRQWYQYAVRDLLGYGIVVAMLKGMVEMILQARAKKNSSDNMANRGLQ